MNLTSNKYDPLIDPIPSEIPLPKAPLIRVISQVRFPMIVSIEKREFIGPFQESIREVYPILRAEQTQQVIFGSQHIETPQMVTTWRFTDTEGNWVVSLTPTFVAIETTHYTNRSDFLERLNRVLDGVANHINPKVIDRLGIRYIDRITGSVDINALFRQEIIGVMSTPVVTYIRQVLSELRLEAPKEKAEIFARWGQLPPNVTPDPATIEPISEKSWILDIDMFTLEPQAFNSKDLTKQAQSYAERIYSLFRWVVKKDFLTQYGGTL